MLRHPLTRSWVPVTRSQVEFWSLVPFEHPVGWAESQSSSVHVVPRAQLLLHHFAPAQNGLPYRYIIRSDGCGYRGVAGFEVGNGRQGAHF